MRRKPPAPLIVACLLQLAVLALICSPQLRTATYLGLFDSFLRSRSFSTLYQAAQDREQAYDVVNNHFTPLTILLQSGFTIFSENVGAWIFQIISIAAAAGALILSVRLFFDTETAVAATDGADDPRGRWRWILKCCIPLTVLSAPLGRCLWMEGPDALVWFLAAAALSLTAAPLTESGDARPKRGLDWMSGVALALAIAIRPYLIVVILPFIVLRRWKILAGFAGASGLLFLLTQRMWFAFVKHELADNDILFKYYDNSSVSTAVYVVRRAQTLGLNNSLLQSILIATFIFSALLFVHLLLDVKIGFPRERREQALFIASYLPFAFAIPLTLDPQFLSLSILLLPYLALLWLRSGNGVQRVGILTSAFGWSMMHANFQTFNVVNDTVVPFCIGGLGTLTLIAGLAIQKAGDLKVRIANTANAPSTSLPWRVFFPLGYERWIYLGMTAVCSALSCWYYAHSGFSTFVVIMWALSIGFICTGLWSESERQFPHIRGRDARICAALTALFVVPYVLYLYDYPVQINTDELSVLDSCRVAAFALKDWFGLYPAYYFFPSGGFKLLTALAEAFGGVTFQHIRMASAICGIACIPAAYFLFRQLYRWKFAVLATLLLGANHVLLGLSRMCLRDNVPLFFELVALAVLIRGWRRNNYGVIALGGAIAGLGVYSYFSARIIIIVWLAFLVLTGAITVVRAMKSGARKWTNPVWFRVLKASAAALAAFLISSAPMMIATAQSPPVAMAYPRAQFVIYPEGRQVLREWEGTDNTKLAMVRSTLKALTMFNNNLDDSVHTYQNYGNGFVDPLTGVLLWVGLWRVLRKKQRGLREILALAGFFVIWLPLSFFIVKNPGFSRFLVILPFVVVFAVEGARVAALKSSRATMALPVRKIQFVLAAAVMLAACTWNGWIYNDHVQRGLTEGDVPGNTVRYADGRAKIPNYSFYVVMDETYPYWFGGGSWSYWIGSFIRQERPVEMVSSSLFLDEARPLGYLKLPCSVYMTKELWLKVRVRVRKEIKKVTVTKIIPNADRLAIELSDGPISR